MENVRFNQYQVCNDWIINCTYAMMISIFRVKNKYNTKIHIGAITCKEGGWSKHRQPWYVSCLVTRLMKKIITRSNKIFENVAKLRYFGMMTNNNCNH